MFVWYLFRFTVVVFCCAATFDVVFFQRLTIVHQGKVEAAKLMEVEKKTPKEDVGVGRGHLVARRHVKICQVHISVLFVTIFCSSISLIVRFDLSYLSQTLIGYEHCVETHVTV